MREVHTQTAPTITIDADSFLARLEREQKARKAAEELIEKKTSELYEANKELEQVLYGGVRVLTDVLAMAKPEVFQKAAKVQRWSRRVASAMKMKRAWELDIAAILYPIGIIALPDEISSKYALDQPLTNEEKELIDESPAAAYHLIHNIPRMEGIAKIIYYSRKGYDGSGFPDENISGDNLPEAARVLRILIDLADLATGRGRDREKAFIKMAEQKFLYDLDILKVAYQCLHEQPQVADDKERVLDLTPNLLRAGDIVHKDIVDGNGRLILAAGAELTDIGIRRLHALYISKGVIEGVSIIRRRST